jgi:hypothetical protein
MVGSYVFSAGQTAQRATGLSPGFQPLSFIHNSGEIAIVGNIAQSERTQVETYATLVFRTAERSLRAILGAIAGHLEFRRDGVNVA